MKVISNILSYLFHPILIPVGGAIIYFSITPKHTPLQNQASTLIPVFILTVIIPIITFYILKNVGLVQNTVLEQITERKYLIYTYIAALLIILYKVIPNNFIGEIYFYFAGLLVASLTTLLLLFLNFKTSFHLTGLGSLLTYIISLSLHFEINLVLLISIITLLTGAVFSSRLFLKERTKQELLIGLLLGIGSQLFIQQYWL